MGGVRQQFSTAAEVRLAQESVRFFRDARARRFFDQVGYLFVATTEEGLDGLAERRRSRRARRARRGASTRGASTGSVRGRCDRRRRVLEDGVAEPAAITRELVRRAVEGGVEVREDTDALTSTRDVLVVACGPRSPELVPELPVRASRAASSSASAPVRSTCRTSCR